MKVTVKLFGPLADRAGTDTVEVEVADGSMVRDAVDQAASQTPGLRDPLNRLSIVVAVNREPGQMDVWLHDGDEVALIPPGAV